MICPRVVHGGQPTGDRAITTTYHRSSTLKPLFLFFVAPTSDTWAAHRDLGSWIGEAPSEERGVGPYCLGEFRFAGGFSVDLFVDIVSTDRRLFLQYTSAGGWN